MVGYRCREFALPRTTIRGIVSGDKKGENDDANKARSFDKALTLRQGGGGGNLMTHCRLIVGESLLLLVGESEQFTGKKSPFEINLCKWP